MNVAIDYLIGRSRNVTSDDYRVLAEHMVFVEVDETRYRKKLKLRRHFETDKDKFKFRMSLCARWDIITEETSEELEDYETTVYYTVKDIEEALRKLEKNSGDDIRNDNLLNMFSRSKKDELTRYDFLPVPITQGPSEPPPPVEPLPEKYVFTEAEKLEFKLLFQEEAKVLMPRFRKSKVNEDIPLSERPRRRLNAEREDSMIDDGEPADTNMGKEASDGQSTSSTDQDGYTQSTQSTLPLSGEPLASDDTVIDISSDSSSIQPAWLRTKYPPSAYCWIYLYMAITVVISILVIGYIISNGIFKFKI